MTREIESPKISQEATGKCDPHDVYQHDAYGTITMVMSTGGNDTLFGSDIRHNRRISIQINRAEMKRDLNRDWIHSRDSILTFEMSHAQFSEFIMSVGNGGGTPITLTRAPAPGTPYLTMPGIQNLETKHDMHRREIADAARGRLEAMSQKIKELGALIESGQTGKTKLREIHKDLDRECGYLPGTMEFVVRSAEDALEKATSDAKIEVEAYISASARKLGLNHIGQLAEMQRASMNLQLEGDALP